MKERNVVYKINSENSWFNKGIAFHIPLRENCSLKIFNIKSCLFFISEKLQSQENIIRNLFLVEWI